MFSYISTFILPSGHLFPTYESVDIIHKKHCKADDDGNIRNIRYGCKNPENDENDIVCRISYRIPRTAAEGEINRHKTCCNGECARQQICGVEMSENKIKNNGYGGGENEHKNRFFFADVIYFHFCFVAFIGVSEPRNKSKNSHRHCHTEIRYHFSVVIERIRDYAVKYAEYHHQHLTCGVAFCVENQRCDAYERRSKSKIIFFVNQKERNENEQNRRAPQTEFKF